jgi:N-acetylmuramoyl-L-alanine amidase
MATNHQAKACDSIGSIAYEYGIPWEEIWNHPKNAELKRLRRDPNILKQGDVVHIPDWKPKPYILPTGKRHRIVYPRPYTRLRLRVVVDPGPAPTDDPAAAPPSGGRNLVAQDPPPDTKPRSDQPRAGVAYDLLVDDLVLHGTTDGDGYIDCKIPPNAAKARLVLAPGTPHETSLAVRIGHLDPADQVSGIKQRLRNLCFDCGDQSDDETPAFAAAVRAFQAKHGLDVTGSVDDRTRAEIVKAHGS